MNTILGTQTTSIQISDSQFNSNMCTYLKKKLGFHHFDYIDFETNEFVTTDEDHDGLIYTEVARRPATDLEVAAYKVIQATIPGGKLFEAD